MTEALQALTATQEKLLLAAKAAREADEKLSWARELDAKAAAARDAADAAWNKAEEAWAEVIHASEALVTQMMLADQVHPATEVKQMWAAWAEAHKRIGCAKTP